MVSKNDLVKELYPEDLYGYAEGLTDGEVEVLQEVREALETHVRPVITDYWEKADFPFAEFKKVTDVGIMNNPKLYVGREGERKPRELYTAFLYLELARFDASIATFYTVHGGLCYNTILLGGNERQIEEFAPKLASFEWQGCFGLTEPDHGSDIAGGLATSARREGNNWILNGEKRWIGGADTADVIPIFARDVEDNRIKCFIVRKGAEGYSADPIPHKGSLRAIRNGHIVMKDVVVPEADRLENINGFRDVSRILVRTRADVAHIAMGISAGAFVAALKYVKQREQFGKSIASFQLVQEKLSRMQANVVANIGYSVRIAQLQEEGRELMLNSALAKMHNSLNMRETVALAREVCGGNGITLETDVMRFFADAEAIYTYEGTHEVNALIVSRELTGIGAFV
ncbi:acyl-CoA dehydrogenase FadE [Fundicoccus culcitae]|uniref:Acyl-CoA dehydrogenase family protein n=1 Tax=Fundicoccus culcitae TaxID=2969821 RepID=A0ABY5P4W5_9LACT|nr:acyl-CoA dehydrogenase family protein [Fundicoccus culcitae]UUX33420.1 acyl-CoA dehydrogenase family protein [Fundicoccus culcitae]